MRPRTSKGITAFSRKTAEPGREAGVQKDTPATRRGFAPFRPARDAKSPTRPHLGLSGLIADARLARGISTYLKHPRQEGTHTFARVATAPRDRSSPQDWPRAASGPRRPLFQVVLPKSSVVADASPPDSGGLPPRRLRLWTSGSRQFPIRSLKPAVTGL